MKITEFGKDVRHLRKKHGVGSRELSRQIGKAETYISQLERGQIKKPDYDICFKILKRFDFKSDKIKDLLENHYNLEMPDFVTDEYRNYDHLNNHQEEDTYSIEYPVDKIQKNILDKEFEIFKIDQKLATYLDRLETKMISIKDMMQDQYRKDNVGMESIINSLYSLFNDLDKDKIKYKFMQELFKYDYSNLPDELKMKVIAAIDQTISDEVNNEPINKD
ncbi:helix-turn-helix domain-containing protein [Bacillus subtilis]|uniref:helix-turn-helix domain-containing protein n=1 Tax=Bacillus subtilis TaxID=1423 RepID=UPI003A8C1C24